MTKKKSSTRKKLMPESELPPLVLDLLTNYIGDMRMRKLSSIDRARVARLAFEVGHGLGEVLYPHEGSAPHEYEDLDEVPRGSDADEGGGAAAWGADQTPDEQAAPTHGGRPMTLQEIADDEGGEATQERARSSWPYPPPPDQGDESEPFPGDDS